MTPQQFLVTLRTGGLKSCCRVSGNVKASFAAVFGFCNSRLSKWRRTLKPSISGSELVRYHDLRPEADAEGINTESIDASRHHCGSVIQPSKLECDSQFGRL
ncbi:MAG: hypothetical protein M0P13_05120 [Fibrobacteraceae bacterium]|nr:hypothetical protein [Fibrobacteraceae bacterium]